MGTLHAMRLMVLGLVLVAMPACGPRDGDGRGAAGTGQAASTRIDEACEPLGRWRHEHPEYASDIDLCLEPDGTPWVRQTFADGTVFESVLTPVFSESGDRYRREVEFGDYYEVKPDGRLTLGDDEGEITTIDPVR